MTLLTELELIAMRSMQAQGLPETVIIQRCSLESDGAGGSVETWTEAGSVGGRIGLIGKSEQERMIAERLGISQGYMVTLPAGTDIGEQDRLTIDGRTFEVVGVVRGSWETARRAVCKEVL